MVKCPKCGTENNDDSRFCINCGADLIEQTEFVSKENMTDLITNEVTQPVESKLAENDTNVDEIFKSSGICPNCFSHLEEDAIICPHCGLKLKESGEKLKQGKKVNLCPNCKSPIKEGLLKCPNCGYKIKGKSGVKKFLVISILIIFIAAFFISIIFFIIPHLKSNKHSPQNKIVNNQKKEINEGNKLRDDALLYEKLRNYDQAIISWGKILKKDPSNEESLYHLSKLYFEKGDFEKSLEYCSKLLQITNRYPEIFFIKSQIEKKRKKYDEAIKDLNSAISLQPDNEKFLASLSEIYMMTGNYQKAFDTLEKLNKISPDKKNVILKLIKCADLIGNQGAKSKYTKILNEKFPEFQKAEILSEKEDLNSKSENFLKNKSENTFKNVEEKEKIITPTEKSEEVSQNQSPVDENIKTQPTERKFSIYINSQAISIPNLKCSVEITIGTKNFHTSCSSILKIDDLKPGTYPYTVTVRYYILTTGELQESYGGSGFVDIKYNNQHLYVKIIGKNVILE